MIKKYILLLLVLLLYSTVGTAQKFFNLTAEQLKIDSLLPHFGYSHYIGEHYVDSVYTVKIEYPEFVPMTSSDILRYQMITKDALPELPKISQRIGIDKMKGSLDISFIPLVYREGKYQKLVSFKLSVQSFPVNRPKKAILKASGVGVANRYAAHSVLADGTWVKIKVDATGIYQLTDALVKQAGFNDPSKVKIYGYGGAWQPEKLTGDYLTATDDLKEVPTCTVNGKRLFFAVGPVTWGPVSEYKRIRNPYSDYGYYFLTASDGEPLKTDSASLLNTYQMSNELNHSLYEVDNYSWFEGGRNLYDSRILSAGNKYDYSLAANGTDGVLSVTVTSMAPATGEITLNDSVVGIYKLGALPEYSSATKTTVTVKVNNLQSENKITLIPKTGNVVRLDYISLSYAVSRPLPLLSSGTFKAPEYVYHITNQDHHGDEAVDMVIILPTSQKLRKQAERLKSFHEQQDKMSVRIVPADELYNEFSSGTPDANAYRRYLKMLYDRSGAKSPKYLVLFGDGFWDNRMNTANLRSYSPDDYLLCYESDNSFSKIYCFVSDDYFCILDDNELLEDERDGEINETVDIYRFHGKPDVAVGRFAVSTPEQADIMLDKIERYYKTANNASWQNVICVMGDDGNHNLHMNDAENIAQLVENNYKGYNVKRVMWDTYTRESSAVGNSFPEVTRVLQKQMSDGALIMNYSGHGAAYCLSHEQVLKLNDFKSTTSTGLPLWITASCDIMPFDGLDENIGDDAMFNPNGGAIAFYGTTRTVYSSYNGYMNRTFMRYLLNTQNGEQLSIGEAIRLAKVALVSGGLDATTNKLQYTLLGDPALKLQMPIMQMVIDSINGNPASAVDVSALPACSVVRVVGHVKNTITGELISDYNGRGSALVKDAKELIVCKLNNTDPKEGASSAYQYSDHTKTVFNGAFSIKNGQFSFLFSVPVDILYSDNKGLMTLYGNSDTGVSSHGEYSNFKLVGADDIQNDAIGPSIYCYLNTENFSNGGTVNTTPYFFATLTDKDGINVSGTGIGHDIELIIDGDMSKTYVLNDHFTYDYASYTNGTVGYLLPELSEGPHKLLFRAWDVLNNSSTTELNFNVSKAVSPSLLKVICTKNPAVTSTSFRIIHDRSDQNLDVTLEIFDFAGRKLGEYSERGVSVGPAYTLNWDLTISNGRTLQTGVYIYRISISNNGSNKVSKADKLIVIGNK